MLERMGDVERRLMHLARAELGQLDALEGEAADAVDQVLGAALHELDLSGPS